MLRMYVFNDAAIRLPPCITRLFTAKGSTNTTPGSQFAKIERRMVLARSLAPPVHASARIQDVHLSIFLLSLSFLLLPCCCCCSFLSSSSSVSSDAATMGIVWWCSSQVAWDADWSGEGPSVYVEYTCVRSWHDAFLDLLACCTWPVQSVAQHLHSSGM